MNDKRRTTLLRILAILLVSIISISVFLLGERIVALANYGYFGIFLFSILANATIILPAPGIAIVFALGGVLNPILVAIAAGIGAGIGELSGYLAGFSGQAVVENQATYIQIRSWMTRNTTFSFLVVFLLAAIPNPFFDLAGIVAGTLRIPIPYFLIWTILGKTVKMLFIAYAGYYSFDFFNLN